ncbi:hypothetical protein D5R81_08790 [Parashewanella spongiae]|uniref:Protein kinase domain-containing protein n=1 Tax=Parashewanella spongiae TaxID=342950 RepID=A0A3A6TYJ0_9GAMM|nr:hypothetical protein [Parashewanella spongiae]MCL1079989.1 hypothetical protein [Parashewanella spongiae]RJY16880.1 hypothetical protein D5R81_08790 [Parashewanella spongiae]
MGISTEQIRAHIHQDRFCIKEAPDRNGFICTLSDSRQYRIRAYNLNPDVTVNPEGESEPRSISVRSKISKLFGQSNSDKIKRIVEAQHDPYKFLAGKVANTKAKVTREPEKKTVVIGFEERQTREVDIAETELRNRCQAAIKIGKYYSNYKYRKNLLLYAAKLQVMQDKDKALPLSEQRRPLEFVIMQHPTKRNWKGEARCYYVDIDGILKTTRDPDTVVSREVSGGTKTVVAKDDVAIELAPKKVWVKNAYGQKFLKAGADFDLEIELENKHLAQQFSRYTSICQTVAVSSRRMIGQNGGVDVFDEVILAELSVDMLCCEQLCIDIKHAHQNHIYFRDIKSENMVFKKNKQGIKHPINIDSPRVRMVDIDMAVSEDYGVKGKNKGSPKYMTLGLMKARVSAEERVRNALVNYNNAAHSSYDVKAKLKERYDLAIAKQQSAEKYLDNYALLATLFEMTEVRGGFQVDEVVERYGAIMPPPKGFAYFCSEPDMVTGWITQYFKPEAKNDVWLFMQDPSTYLLKKPVYDVIDWERIKVDSTMM